MSDLAGKGLLVKKWIKKPQLEMETHHVLMDLTRQCVGNGKLLVLGIHSDFIIKVDATMNVLETFNNT